MQLVLKVSTIISRTSWRTLPLCGLLCRFLDMYPLKQGFILSLKCFYQLRKGYSCIFLQNVPILLRPAASSKILVHVSSADLLGGLRPVSPQPCKRGQAETESGFSCLPDNSSMEKTCFINCCFQKSQSTPGAREAVSQGRSIPRSSVLLRVRSSTL